MLFVSMVVFLFNGLGGLDVEKVILYKLLVDVSVEILEVFVMVWVE